MAQHWFVSRGEHVYGPWSTEDVHAHRRDGNILKADLIWGVGTAHWISINTWDPNARTAPVAALAPVEEITKVSAPRAALEESTQIGGGRRPAHQEAWHLAFDGRSAGPFSRSGLMVELRRLATVENVSLWTKGMREWAPVVEFSEILNELGANQRQFARATIKGNAVLKYDGLTQNAPLSSISEGGFGLRLDSDLVTGQIVHVEVQGTGLGAKVEGTAEIRYCAGGVVGLKFVGIDPAARAVIARFVKQHPADDAAKVAA